MTTDPLTLCLLRAARRGREVLKFRRAFMTGDANYVCDFCGYQSDDVDDVMNHVRDEHNVQPGEVGRVDQEDGVLTLRHADGTEVVVDLEQWLKDTLGK